MTTLKIQESDYSSLIKRMADLDELKLENEQLKIDLSQARNLLAYNSRDIGRMEEIILSIKRAYENGDENELDEKLYVLFSNEPDPENSY